MQYSMYIPGVKWYFDPEFNILYSILTPWSNFRHSILIPIMVYWTLYCLLIRNEGVQNTMGFQFTIQGDIHFQYTMEFKIPYDTGVYVCRKIYLHWIWNFVTVKFLSSSNFILFEYSLNISYIFFCICQFFKLIIWLQILMLFKLSYLFAGCMI